jgi:hypothetical protein
MKTCDEMEVKAPPVLNLDMAPALLPPGKGPSVFAYCALKTVLVKLLHFIYTFPNFYDSILTTDV